jgi:hypothetical protein
MHDKQREPGRIAAVATEHDGSLTGTVGKTTLAQGVAGDAAATNDPAQALAELVTKVQHAAMGGHARNALHLMATVAGAVQAQIASAIGAPARHHLAQHLPTDVGNSHATRESAEILFDQTPDTERSTVELFFEKRFRMQAGKAQEDGRQWDVLGLRRLWDVFKALPAAQVARNWAVATLDRYKDTDDKDPRHAHGAFGVQESGAGEIDISYQDSIIRDGGTTDHDREGDPLHGVNRFDEVARHEVGHAVDRELGLPSFNVLSETAEAGRWEGYYDKAGYHKAAEEMVKGSHGPIHHLPAHERHQVIAAMVQSMEHSTPTHFNHVIAGLPHHHGLEHDPVFLVMNKGQASNNPWLGTSAIAGRHYHQAYAGGPPNGAGAQWVSYEEAAYKDHKVSEYQFRAIQEWFAEAYSAFYTPVNPGEEKGIRLKGKLPKTHAWFVAHVDNKKAAARESKAARKYDHAPRKP